MANVLSSLYPPLVDTFQSPFLYTESAKISFTISPYNSSKEIKRLHVTLVNQKTNQNVFAVNPDNLEDEAVLTNGVLIVPFNNNYYLECDENKNYCTLTIPSNLLRETDNQEPSFVCDCYYKVQIRVDNSEAQIDSLYLNTERAHFSEWSSVTLLKAIPEIVVKLVNFDLEDGTTKIPQYTPGVIPITGNVSFISPSENTGEHLESFKAEIVDINQNIIKESDLEYVKGQKNTFTWLCDLTDTEIDKKYYVNLYLTTNNGYTIYKQYSFRLINASALIFRPVWDFNKIKLPYTTDIQGQEKTLLVTSEDGWITITVTVPNSLPPGYLFIKRANSLDKYLNWEIVDCTYFADGTNISTTFIDKTVGSLVNYKYSCQYLTTSGLWSRTVKTTEIVYPDFYDSLILRGDKQLAIRYNAQISNMTPVVNRVKVDTLGGKYPRFMQNARMHYKQFQITGMITAESDYNRKFISDLDYQDEMDIYNQQMNGKYIIRNDTAIDNPYGEFSQHDEYPTENWWWERKFREEAMEWLNDGEPKLYRSMTEGNLIVVFDSVSLTPNQQLGRRIWNFSATAYEVGDGYSLANLDSLGIFSVKNEFDEDKYSNSEEQKRRTNTKSWVGQKTNYKAKDTQTTLLEEGNSSFITQQTEVVNRNNQEVAVLVTSECQSIVKEIEDEYGGFYDDYQIQNDSLYLNDVKVYFESQPQWYDLTSMNLKQNSPDASITFTIGGTKYTFVYNDEIKQYVLQGKEVA